MQRYFSAHFFKAQESFAYCAHNP